MEAKASKHASKRVHACPRARARVCVRGLHGPMAALVPGRRAGGGPAEDGSELRSHACGVAEVETRGRVPGVGRSVVVTPREVRPRQPDGGRRAPASERGGRCSPQRRRRMEM